MPNETASANDSKKIQVRADTTGLDKGRDFVVEALIELLVDTETTFALTTSYLELFENIIRYGNVSRQSYVTVEVFSDGKTTGIAISDSGSPFSILDYRDVGQSEMIKHGIAGKMGIKTIMTLCDKVEYRRDGQLNKHILLKNRG
jgi:anti-sigma regulatory factor (Ser/Thr protein kinase)